MASITSLKASDGSGNASVATVQSVRSPLATTLVVDTVQGINTKFHATMGTPHTFVDPVTSETITVISEASAVDFQGHVDGGNLEIDTIAPGFTDNGSAVSDIVIIKPTTQWADQVATVLNVAHDDDGTLKAGAVDNAAVLASNVVETPKIKDANVTATKIDWASTGANAGIWWEEIGRTTLSSSSDTITVSSIPARNYLQIRTNYSSVGGTISAHIRFNNDNSANYAHVLAQLGSSATTIVSDVGIVITGASAIINQFVTIDVFNVSNKEKLVHFTRIEGNTTGAGTAPTSLISIGKWANTSTTINRIDIVNTLGTGDFAIGSELVVLGHN